MKNIRRMFLCFIKQLKRVRITESNPSRLQTLCLVKSLSDSSLGGSKTPPTSPAASPVHRCVKASFHDLCQLRRMLMQLTTRHKVTKLPSR